MKILLMCGAGASSGFMAQAMRKAAKAEGLTDLEIIARSDSEMMSNLKGTDLIMFGPHLAYKEDALAKDLAPHNIPYCFIDRDAYGSIDGKAALKQALDILAKNGKTISGESDHKDESASAKETAASSAPNAEAKGFMGWIVNSLSPKLNKLTQNIYISAIQQSIMSILPMIMIGSVASIVGVLKRFAILSWLPDISQLNTFSFGLMALFLSALIPMKVMEKAGNEKLKIYNLNLNI